jgi:hypothetical protein
MAVKTFSASEVLTASDTNTYLNNGGLVYISNTTITAGSPTATVSSCFSSTYDRYKIVISTSASAAGGTQGFILIPNGSNVGNYTSWMYQIATSSTISSGNGPAQTYIFLGYCGNNQMVFELDNYNGFASTGKTGTIRWSSYDSTQSTGGTGAHWGTNGTSNTGFTVQCGGGLTMGAGNIIVYGYRKP